MTKWQSSVKWEIYSGKKKLKKVGSDFEWRVYGVSNAKMLEVIRVLGTFRYLRRILLTKPLFYWYWQKGLNFGDNWQSHNPLVTLWQEWFRNREHPTIISRNFAIHRTWKVHGFTILTLPVAVRTALSIKTTPWTWKASEYAEWTTYISYGDRINKSMMVEFNENRKSTLSSLDKIGFIQKVVT